MTIRIGQDAISNPNPALTLASDLLASFGFTAEPMTTSTNGNSAGTAAPMTVVNAQTGESCVPMTIVIDRSGLVLVTSPLTGFSTSFQAEEA